MRIDHVAIAVEDLESAVKQYVDAFGITDIEYETVESEKVKVAILKMENASIELMASTGDGPIKKFLDTRGSGLHHVALETPDIDGQVSKMESCGVKILGGVRPGSRGTRITFVHPKSLSGVLAELCEHFPSGYFDFFRFNCLIFDIRYSKRIHILFYCRFKILYCNGYMVDAH